MKIIQEITEDLIQTNISLEGPLFKGKLLARKINNEVLLGWINNELDGYPILMYERDKNVPAYRKHGASLVGSYYIYNIPFDNIPLPTSGLSAELFEFMNNVTLYESVSALEKMRIEGNTSPLSITVPPELCAAIEKPIRDTNPGFRLVKAKKVVSSALINQILTSIRSKFLDFILELDQQFGESSESG